MNAIDNIEDINIVNKSKFITNLMYIENISEINSCLNSIKNKYKDATHHCYAYIIDNNKKFSDDKEPSGTAGKPILDVLEKNELHHVLCVVTRYFGGIKLGANNLLRTYTNSVSSTIKKAKMYKLVDGYNIEIDFDYSETKNIDNILSDSIVIQKEFNEFVTYNTNIEIDTLKALEKTTADIKIIKKTKIKKAI